MSIKFNKHNVTNGTNKARVRYSLDNHISGKNCITIYAKDYNRELQKLFPQDSQNDSDMRSDYCETTRVRIFEGHPLYAVARAKVEAIKAK